MNLKYIKPKPITLKGHSQFDEKWLQDRIAEDPSILGLGDLGAEVIKIEPPNGEGIRLSNPPPSHKGESGYFLAFNRNKKSIMLNLVTETGREAFYDLVKISDVVWDNNRAGVMERLKADYNTLKNINPGIICCSVTGYGSSGPHAAEPSYDIIAQGMAGLLLQTGQPGGPPHGQIPSRPKRFGVVLLQRSPTAGAPG